MKQTVFAAAAVALNEAHAQAIEIATFRGNGMIV